MVTGTGVTKKKPAKRGTGRPPKIETQRIRDHILDAAASLFFTEGYGAVSMEAVARRLRMSKRTLYHRFADKPELFRAVVHRVIARIRPANTDILFEGKTLDEILLVLARAILNASLSPEALALHHVILAEAKRFPELALIMNEQGARKEAVTRIASLLEREAQNGNARPKNAGFAAEQFLHMTVAAPQRRAMGLGQPMTPEELDQWAKDTVRLFLDGYNGKS